MIGDICENPNFLKALSITSTIINVILFAIPMILMFMVILDVVKMILGNNEIKENLGTIFKRIIAAVIIFLVPTFARLFLNMITSGENALSNYTRCLNNIKNISYYQTRYDAIKDQTEKAKEEEKLKQIANYNLYLEQKKALSKARANSSSSTNPSTSTQSAANKKYKVLINPSHQIYNKTKSSNKLYKTEKLSMYIFADLVKKELKARGYTVYLDAYNNDTKLQTGQIQKLINESNAKKESVVYLALHSNATGTSAQKIGPAVYYASGFSNSEKLASKICNTTYAVYKNNSLTPSFSLSGCTHTSTRISEPKRFYSNGGKGAAVLIEIGYHDNVKNQTFIEKKGQELAKAVADGVDNYLSLK